MMAQTVAGIGEGAESAWRPRIYLGYVERRKKTCEYNRWDGLKTNCCDAFLKHVSLGGIGTGTDWLVPHEHAYEAVTFTCWRG